MTNSRATPSSRQPWALLTSIYITQYIGLAFFFASTVVILRDSGMSLNKLAMLNFIAIPLLLKIFYAPFIDTIHPSFFIKKIQGKYRSWLVVSQFLMMVLLVVISTLDVTKQFSIALLFMLVYGFAVSFQDVAIDGLACKIFSKDERPRASSIQFSSNLVGNIIGGGLILMAYPWLKWQGSLWVLALLTGVSWLQLLRYVEPKFKTSVRQRHSWRRSLKELIKDIWQFIKLHKVWFVLLIIYPLSFSASFSLLNPLLVDAKWTFADIGFVTKVFGSVVGVVSALSAGLLIDKLGRVKTLFLLTILQALVLLLFLPLSYGFTSKIMVYSVVGAYFMINPALMTTVATIAMDKASLQTFKATFFTLQLGTFSFMGFVFSGVAMTLASSVGYKIVFIGGVILSLIIMVFMRIKRTMFAT